MWQLFGLNACFDFIVIAELLAPALYLQQPDVHCVSQLRGMTGFVCWACNIAPVPGYCRAQLWGPAAPVVLEGLRQRIGWF